MNIQIEKFLIEWKPVVKRIITAKFATKYRSVMIVL